MRPYNDINIGDIYQRYTGAVDWMVVNKNDDEKMIELESSYQHPSLPRTLWKRNTDSIFNRRVYKVGDCL